MRHVEDILQRRARFGGNQADAFRHCRQGLLVLRSEQTFLVKLFLELLECHLHCTNTVRKHIFHIDLKRAVPLEQRNPAPHDDAHAVLRHECQILCITPEHNCFDRALLVFQGKIKMSGLIMVRKIGYLAAQRHIC